MRLVSAALLLVVSVAPAFAQREPEIVIPGRPDVPVIIDGVDASWGVVEGEFGLDRPGAMAPVVIYRPLLVAVPSAAPPGYFPKEGTKPGYGRLEIVPPPNRPKPPPAPTYYRNWSTQSPALPPTEYQQYDMPPVVVEPRYDRRAGRNGSNAGNAGNRSPTGGGQGPH